MSAATILAVVGTALAVAVIAAYLVALAVVLRQADRQLAQVAARREPSEGDSRAVAASLDSLAEELEQLRDRLDRVPTGGVGR